METHESHQGAGAYLFACQNGDIRCTPATVFFRIENDLLTQHLLDLFEKEYGENEGRPTFHAQAVADSPDTDQILLDEALDELAVYDDPDPGVYDPPPSRQTILRAFYARRAELWAEILRSRVASNRDSAKDNGHPLMKGGHPDRCRASGSDKPVTPNQNKSETPTELAQMQRLLECLVRIDNGVMSLGGKLARLRGEDPHGLTSQPNSKRASFDQVREIQERIEKWASPILEAAREAQEVCSGISNYVEPFIDDPIRWETDLRETLRLLRDVVASLPHTHGSERDEAQIVSLAAGLYTQGTRLEDGLSTLEGRKAHLVNTTSRGMKQRGQGIASNTTMPNKAQQCASALQELRLATGELLHRSEKVDIYPEPEINAYHHALRDAESLVDGISSHLAYGRENPGQIETDLRETLHDLSRKMEHVTSDYNDRPGAYPLSKEETAPGWKALKGLMPIEMALKMTTMKPGELEMPVEDRRISGLTLLMLLAQAYYKMMECVISMASWCSSLDVELNQSYLWVTGNLTNLLKNHEDLKDFPVQFKPLFDDLYPSTVRDIDWDDMVAPEAERFLSTVQRYVHEKGVYEPEEGSTAWTFVQLFRPSIETAISQALDYHKRMHRYAQKSFCGSSAAGSIKAAGAIGTASETNAGGEITVGGETRAGAPTASSSSVKPSQSTTADNALPAEDTKYEWARQAELVRATDQVLGEGQLNKGVLARACGSQIETNGKSGQGSRVKVSSFLPWIARKFGLPKDELIQIRNAIIGEINDRKS